MTVTETEDRTLGALALESFVINMMVISNVSSSRVDLKSLQSGACGQVSSKRNCRETLKPEHQWSLE
jgi:hypothetical protein